MTRIGIDIGTRVLTDEHVAELVRLKRGASDDVYFVLAKVIDVVEQAVADAKHGDARPDVWPESPMFVLDKQHADPIPGRLICGTCGATLLEGPTVLPPSLFQHLKPCEPTEEANP